MGLFADSVRALIPERKAANAAAAVPVGVLGVPQYPDMQAGGAYYRFAREGYSANEIIFACIEELATSAAEPRMMAYRKTASGPEKLTDHDSLELFEHPNPWMDRYTFIASIIMYRMIAGNAYVEKVTSAAGKAREFWLLRPDRMRVIPGTAREHIRAYRYEIGTYAADLPAATVIHHKQRHPLDDYHGLAPLAVVAPRVDTDNWMRSFTRSFFTNAGVPAGLLNIQRAANDAEKEAIRARFRAQYGGPAGWNNLLVIDNAVAKYEPMGLPLGRGGLVVPELDEINEARLAMCFGVPLELIGARLGMVHGNRSTTKEARATFWDETLLPLYEEMGAAFTLGLRPDYPDVDYWAFDTSTIKALQEDEDAKHLRIREDVKAGLLTRKEGRQALGVPEEPEATDDVWLMPVQLQAVPVGEDAPEPAPPGPPGLDALRSAAPARAQGAEPGQARPDQHGRPGGSGALLRRGEPGPGGTPERAGGTWEREREGAVSGCSLCV